MINHVINHQYVQLTIITITGLNHHHHHHHQQQSSINYQ